MKSDEFEKELRSWQMYFKKLLHSRLDKKQISLLGIRGNNLVDIERRFSIYRNHYRMTLCKNLMNVYRVCTALVGEDFFKMLAHDYIDQNPSRNIDINQYGEAFPKFVANHELVSDLGYFEDLAQLEWIKHELECALDDGEEDHLSYEEFEKSRQKNNEQFYFFVPRSVRIFASEYPVYDIWRMGDDIVDCGQEIGDEGQYVILWRNHTLDSVQVGLLNEKQWQLLKDIYEDPFLTKSCKFYEQEPAALGRLLYELMVNNWVYVRNLDPD